MANYYVVKWGVSERTYKADNPTQAAFFCYGMVTPEMWYKDLGTRKDKMRKVSATVDWQRMPVRGVCTRETQKSNGAVHS